MWNHSVFRTPRAATRAAGGSVLAQPALEVEVVELLAPQHARQRLAVHAPLVLAQRRGVMRS
jgi:hypothetical protein